MTDTGKLLVALITIRDMPMPEQDDMLSANMRQIAKEALKVHVANALDLTPEENIAIRNI
jgi:hypothetical protein